MPKRRRSSLELESCSLPESKKRLRVKHPLDKLSTLSDEILIRILHNLPIEALLQCQLISRRFYTLAGDSQIWKSLYYNRFVLPRALRIPGIKNAPAEEIHFSSRRSKWLDDNTLVGRVDRKEKNWKGQYKLRYNWSIGACCEQEIRVADQPSVPCMLMKLAGGIVLTADKAEGLRAWDLKEKGPIAKCALPEDVVPTCIAMDEQESSDSSLSIALGFLDGGWALWKLDKDRKFVQGYKHPASSNGALSALAYADPYVLTMTDGQLLSLYRLENELVEDVADTEEGTPLPMDNPDITLAGDEGISAAEPYNPSKPPPPSQIPRLIASLRSHTACPPLSLSIRPTPQIIIFSIAYSFPSYLSGYSIGLQELHLSLATSSITFSRIASSLPQGFRSTLPTTPSPPKPTYTSRPTSLAYSHPYILATHPDNTLTLYLCTSTSTSLSISPGTKLWGHTSSVSSAQITPRGKAVSASTRGNELRVWELEGGSSSARSVRNGRKSKRSLDGSVKVRTESGSRFGGGEGIGAKGGFKRRDGEGEEVRKQWVGFDDEMVVVLKESEMGSQALMVYDFT